MLNITTIVEIEECEMDHKTWSENLSILFELVGVEFYSNYYKEKQKPDELNTRYGISFVLTFDRGKFENRRLSFAGPLTFTFSKQVLVGKEEIVHFLMEELGKLFSEVSIDENRLKLSGGDFRGYKKDMLISLNLK